MQAGEITQVMLLLIIMTIGAGTIGILLIGELVGTIGMALAEDGVILIMALLGVGILGMVRVGDGDGIHGTVQVGVAITTHITLIITDIMEVVEDM